MRSLIQVVHIAEHDGSRGGRVWMLTLACGHRVSRAIPPIRPDSIVVRNAWKRQRAPERVQCHYCENPVGVGSWTGPREGELDDQDRLTRVVPPERAPFCYLTEHELSCSLRTRGLVAGSFCDCSASAAVFEDDRKHKR